LQRCEGSPPPRSWRTEGIIPALGLPPSRGQSHWVGPRRPYVVNLSRPSPHLLRKLSMYPESDPGGALDPMKLDKNAAKKAELR
jgi:hypothetical protein